MRLPHVSLHVVARAVGAEVLTLPARQLDLDQGRCHIFEARVLAMLAVLPR
jgi:hypothetical protein